MKSTLVDATLAGIALERTAAVPLHRQLESALRAAILGGQLPGGARLPPTRELARGLGVSRSTVVEVFEVLGAEGYLQARVGDGTYVATLGLRHAGKPTLVTSTQSLSARGSGLVARPLTPAAHSGPPRAFRTGMPDPTLFPWRLWARLEARHWRDPPENVGYADPRGHGPLREAIAAYLGASRGVQCTPEQILVTSGTQGALDLIARMLLDAGEEVLMENPGYGGAKLAFRGAGLRMVPTPVDVEGLDVEAGATRAPQARLTYVTPSHQYPLGVVMSVARRLALLDWASQGNRWVVEDDYDSEYRYAGPPLSALHALDTENRVLYVGSFSKTLLPALRVGYLVVPLHLASAFAAAKNALERSGPTLTAAVLASFLSEGHFARHLRRTRKAYGARHETLVGKSFGPTLQLLSAEAGLHLVGRLPPGVDDVALANRAAAAGVEVNPLSAYYLEDARPGLLLGYAVVDEDAIIAGAKVLRSLLESC